MTIAVWRAERDVEGLAPAWHALAMRGALPSPFQSPHWLVPWWRVFGNGRPVFATLGDPGGLRGVLALYELDGRLLPVGAGLTDYQDVLLETPGVEAMSDLLAAALRATRLPCDLIDLPPDSSLSRATAPVGWLAERVESDPCPVLTIDPSDPLAAVPDGKRRDIRQYRHRAERAGGWRVETDATGDALPGLKAWHTARHPGLDPRIWAFHSLAAPALLELTLARIYVLRVGKQVVAGYYVLLAPGRMLFYLGGFNPDFAVLSPSTILMAEIIALAAAEGRTELHFLRGNEPYKYAWGARDRRNMQILLRPT